MRSVQAFLSTYTADVSGVCSALFELGGMTVMHDASGCNSTYNTHDEPRWYDFDSMVYISGLSEMEAVMGDDSKLIDDIIYSVNELKPEFVAIAGTPVPMMTGVDLPAIAEEVEAATGVPAFGIETNGMHSYVRGAGAALAAYAERMTEDNPGQIIKGSMNILGLTPLDFSVNGSAEAMRAFFESRGRRVIGTWAMGSSPEELKQAGLAEVNLVVSSVGLPAARVLEKKFGTPYVVGAPFGAALGDRLAETMDEVVNNGSCIRAVDVFPPAPEKRPSVVIIGEAVTSRSLAASLFIEEGTEARIICPVEAEPGLSGVWDRELSEEAEIIEALRGAKLVYADPLYKRVLPAGCRLVSMPHEAYSGRIFRKAIKKII